MKTGRYEHVASTIEPVTAMVTCRGVVYVASGSGVWWFRPSRWHLFLMLLGLR